MAPEVYEALQILKEDNLDVSVLSVTSADRLYKNWKESQKKRSIGNKNLSRIEELF